VRVCLLALSCSYLMGVSANMCPFRRGDRRRLCGRALVRRVRDAAGPLLSL
jgi:hypothetical protein